MRSYHTNQSEQEAQQEIRWDRFRHSRLPIAVGVSTLTAFFVAVGQPDGWRWFLLTFVVTMPALLLIIRLLAEVVIAAIVFVKEWRDVFTSGS